MATTEETSERIRLLRESIAGKLAGILAKDTSFTANITIPKDTYVNAKLVGRKRKRK